MIIVIARAEVDPARIAELRSPFDAMMRATWEDSGCLSYSMAVESEDRGVVSIVARWQDEAALKLHFKTPHVAVFNAAVMGAVTTIDAKVYEVTGESDLVL